MAYVGGHGHIGDNCASGKLPQWPPIARAPADHLVTLFVSQQQILLIALAATHRRVTSCLYLEA